jgi:SAM-dependent methyltransferase
VNSSSDSCPACSTDKVAFAAGGTPFGLRKCGACGLVRTEPMPDNAALVDFYQQFAFEKPHREDVEHDVLAIKASLTHFIGVPQPGRNRFLDYGGGFGIYCKAARQLGWEPSLFDYDRGCLDYAKLEMGVERAVDNLADFQREKFDVIWGFHVIEHWNRIDENMKALLELLAPGGRVVFATPHADSCEKWARPYHLRNYARGLVARGESWGRAILLTLKLNSFLCWDPPRHLFAFSADALREIGSTHGLNSCIETGYNTSLLHEPRQYVVPNPFAPRFKVPPGASPLSSLLRTAFACFSWAGCGVLRRIFPNRGEQLYVTYMFPD